METVERLLLMRDIEMEEYPLLTIITNDIVPADTINEFLKIKGVNKVSIY